MNRELTTAAIAAIGFFFLAFGYKSAFGVQLSGMSSMGDNFLQLVGILIMSVGVGILVSAFLYYRHHDKQ